MMVVPGEEEPPGEEDIMINGQDIVDMGILSREEIAALAEHAHTSECSATLMAEYLLHLPHGAARVQEMIADDIRAALHAHELDKARALYATLHHFIAEHPEAVRGVSSDA